MIGLVGRENAKAWINHRRQRRKPGFRSPWYRVVHWVNFNFHECYWLTELTCYSSLRTITRGLQYALMVFIYGSTNQYLSSEIRSQIYVKVFSSCQYSDYWKLTQVSTQPVQGKSCPQLMQIVYKEHGSILKKYICMKCTDLISYPLASEWILR